MMIGQLGNSSSVWVVCLTAFGISMGCNQPKQGFWRSAHHPIELSLAEGWNPVHVNQPGDTVDTPEKVVQAFLNRSSNATYLIRLEIDPTGDKLSDDDYLNAVRAQYAAQPAYKLLDENEVVFHGRMHHRMRFRLEGNKGRQVMYVHIRRANGRLATVQWTFPMIDESTDVPDVIGDFDRTVRIDEK